MTPGRRRRVVRALIALVTVATAGLVGCGDDGPEPSGPTRPAGIEGTITVSAAASLTEAFTRIGDDFTAAHPGTEVTFTFDSSSTLANQIVEGAPADVFAAADEPSMAGVVDADLVAGRPVTFARNQLVIVTKPGNPEGITGLADLVDVGVVALCGEEVPCGRLAGQVLDASGVAIAESSITRGQNAKATLSAVAEGDAVAGIVYVTDAAAAGDAVDTVAVPANVNAVTTYPIAVLADSAEADVAEAFVDRVTGDQGQAVLADLGFLPPA